MAYSGTLTNDNDTVTQAITGVENFALVTISGTFSGMTILFEVSKDGVTYSAAQGVSGATVATSTTTTGNWKVEIGGYNYFQVRSHPVSTGSATINFTFGVGTVAPLATQPAALGQGASAASVPVVIASDQSAFIVNPVAPTENTYLASAGRTTTQTQGDQTNTLFKGICVILDMTVVGTGSVTLEIDAKDPTSGKYYVLLTGAAVVTNVTNTYTVYPSIVNTANVSASNVLPKTWRLKVTANNANSATYSVGYNLLP